MTSWSRGGMRAFREWSHRSLRSVECEETRSSTSTVATQWEDAKEVGEGRSRVYREVVAKSKSVYPRSAKLYSEMEAREEEEGGGGEGREAASANVTGLHSDVGVQRLHRRASSTDMHARATHG